MPTNESRATELSRVAVRLLPKVAPTLLEVDMATDTTIIQTGQGWFIETPTGRVGPMDSQTEAHAYLALMRLATAAGTEVACTDAECFN